MTFPHEKVFQIATVESVIENVKDMLRTAKNAAGVLEKTADSYGELIKDCEDLLRLGDHGFNLRALSVVSEIQNEVTHQLRESSMNLYKGSSVLVETPNDNQPLYYPGMALNLDPDECCVDVKIHNGLIYVRTPLLWSKKGNGLSRVAFFRDEIAESIRKAEGFQELDLGRFKYKVVHFLYVYGASQNRLYTANDNDNHETKHVQDAITGVLPCGDTPLHCSIFLSATATNEVPEGTYITVYPMDSWHFNDADVIEMWKQQEHTS